MTQTNRLYGYNDDINPIVWPRGQVHVCHENMDQVFICVFGQIIMVKAVGFGGGRVYHLTTPGYLVILTPNLIFKIDCTAGICIPI